MLDSVKPYDIQFIQKASPKEGDAFDFSYIYKFWTDRTARYQSLKYIIRVEAHGDVFAIKFYAARDKKLDNKYSRILKAHSYLDTLRIFLTCSSVVFPVITKHPSASFVINGAQSMDLESGKMENNSNNQRFRLYKYIAMRLFGRKSFGHYNFPEVSSYLMVNRFECQDVEQKKDEIMERLITIYDMNI